MKEWHVILHDGYATQVIGSVYEDDEPKARLAALSKYGTEGNRERSLAGLIFEDDEFTVQEV